MCPSMESTSTAVLATAGYWTLVQSSMILFTVTGSIPDAILPRSRCFIRAVLAKIGLFGGCRTPHWHQPLDICKAVSSMGWWFVRLAALKSLIVRSMLGKSPVNGDMRLVVTGNLYGCSKAHGRMPGVKFDCGCMYPYMHWIGQN